MGKEGGGKKEERRGGKKRKKEKERRKEGERGKWDKQSPQPLAKGKQSHNRKARTDSILSLSLLCFRMFVRLHL